VMKTSQYKKAPGDGRHGSSQHMPTVSHQPHSDQDFRFKQYLSTVLTMVFVAYALATCLCLSAPAWSAALRLRDAAPVVQVKNGSYSGIHNAEFNQDYFLGMPYAKTAERFRISEGLDATWNDTRPATQYPKHCVGYGGDMIGYESSEDCLYLNVIRPAGVSPDAKLPVAVWIHGGGLAMGGSADKRYNLSFIVDNSVKQGTPLIGVSLNYRLSVFGFPGGKQALEAGATNLGFRDQRLALHWVNENIASFGGAPDKVTIFGESSGAESVANQVLAYNGRDDGLFRAVAAESGFGGVIPRGFGGFNSTTFQTNFDQLVGNITSCASTAGTPESFECLRTAPLEEINAVLDATGSPFSFTPVKDGDFIADFATNQLARGDFVKVPILIGANSDEGTSFGPGRGPKGPVNTDEDMAYAVANIIPSQASETTGKTIDELVKEALALYPNDQAVGIPSLEMWPHIIQPGEDIAVALGLQQRRAAAFFGDVYMGFLRRRANTVWAENGVPSFAYRFDIRTNGFPEYVGSTHFSEVSFVFDNVNGLGYATNPFGGNDTTYTTKAVAMAKTISTAWVNFFVSLDPSGAPGLGEWPVYDIKNEAGVGSDMVFGIDGPFVETDDWRKEGMEWMMEHALDIFGN